MAKPANYQNFKLTLEDNRPPKDWPEALMAVWFAKKDDWEASHNIAQEMKDDLGSWIHAYLHRQEGDEFNAGYWYRRAGRAYPKKSLQEELQEITEYIISI